MKRSIKVTTVAGVEGMALYVDAFRVAGPKPWGGGVVRNEWSVDVVDLEEAIRRAGGAPVRKRARRSSAGSKRGAS